MRVVTVLLMRGKKKFIFQLFLENHGGTLVMGSAIVMGF